MDQKAHVTSTTTSAPTDSDLLDAFHEFSAAFRAAMKELEEEQEAWWNALSKDDQLKAFCAISRRIFKGEIEVQGTYRYVLYQVFGFGPEAYAQAQDAGYLAIHNSIISPEQEIAQLRAFARHANLDSEIVTDYVRKTF